MVQASASAAHDRVRASQPLNRGRDLQALVHAEFRPNRRHGLPRRITDLLIWGVVRAPFVEIPFPIVAQAVFGVRTDLAVRSPLVDQVRRELHRVRVLLNRHRYDLIRTTTGIRASIDLVDVIEGPFRADLARLHNRSCRVGKTLLVVCNHAGTVSRHRVPHSRSALHFSLLCERLADAVDEIQEVERALQEVPLGAPRDPLIRRRPSTVG